MCIFPEGRLTSDGEIGEFRAGMMRILKETPVPVVPMALTGLWDSMFSRKYGALWRRWPRRFWPKIGLRVGAPIPAGTRGARSIATGRRCVTRRGSLSPTPRVARHGMNSFGSSRAHSSTGAGSASLLATRQQSSKTEQ